MFNKFKKTIHNKYSRFYDFIFFLRYLFIIFFISTVSFLSIPHFFDYEKKFQFPFIIAVKGKNKNEILENFRSRINNDYVKEFQEAKKQVIKIALFRLNEILDTN